MTETTLKPGGAFLSAVRARASARAAESRIGAELKAAQDRDELATDGRPKTVREPDGFSPATAAAIGIPRQRAAEFKQMAAGEEATRDEVAANPVDVADACERAGRPELILGLLRQRASIADVQAALQRAEDITEAARQLGTPEMAETAILGGVSLETFREMATAMRASS